MYHEIYIIRSCPGERPNAIKSVPPSFPPGREKGGYVRGKLKQGWKEADTWEICKVFPPFPMVWRNGNVYSPFLSLSLFLSFFLRLVVAIAAAVGCGPTTVAYRPVYPAEILPRGKRGSTGERDEGGSRTERARGRWKRREGEREGGRQRGKSTGDFPRGWSATSPGANLLRRVPSPVEAPNQIFIDSFEGKMYRLTDRRGVPEMRAGTWPCSANPLLIPPRKEGEKRGPTDVSWAQQLTLRILGIFMKRRLETLSVFRL